MEKHCPDCGLILEDDPKFCPACGAALKTQPSADPPTDTDPSAQPNTPPDGLPTDAASPADKAASSDNLTTVEPYQPAPSESAELMQKKRVFVEREQKYGDTARYDDFHEYKDAPAREPAQTAKNAVSLYLSIVALVLSVTAIALVIIFAILPANQRAEKSDAVPQPTAATAAPTQAPTDPPITGEYSLAEIRGEGAGLMTLMLRSSRLEMNSDYTGTLTVGGMNAADIALDKETGSARFLNTDCTFRFDGKVLTIDYNDMTLVYKKI